jgi:hypothetical protein
MNNANNSYEQYEPCQQQYEKCQQQYDSTLSGPLRPAALTACTHTGAHWLSASIPNDESPLTV